MWLLPGFSTPIFENFLARLEMPGKAPSYAQDLTFAELHGPGQQFVLNVVGRIS